MAHTWAAENAVSNYSGQRDRADRQKQEMAKDRRTAGRAAGRGRRSI